MRRESWSVESTIGLLFTIIIAILALAIVSAIGLAAYAAMDTGPSQRIVQQVETTGDVRRLCIEARTGERVDAMSSAYGRCCEVTSQAIRDKVLAWHGRGYGATDTARQLGLPLEEVRAIIREGDGRPKPPCKVEFIEPPLFEE